MVIAHGNAGRSERAMMLDGRQHKSTESRNRAIACR
jgi:hypothetical protein